ncbi:MAG: carboxypeptidase-like regulatory domain-containing protein [Flavobacteriales bacterium]|nr:carboxypeptidase-like regulatory domain-containing protein [Flavobacteriales bacterium]
MPNVAPLSITAQQTGIFKGKTVEKNTGRRLFGVVVELVGTGRAYVTSPTGYFKLEDVEEGTYIARFTFPGFAPVEESITIQHGETLDLTVEFEKVE